MKKILTLLLLFLLLSCSTQTITKNEAIKKPEVVKQTTKSEIIDLGDNWYKITTNVKIANISPEQAKELALQKAYRLAIEKFSGIEIKTKSAYLQSFNSDELVVDNFSELTNQASAGIILEKNIVEELDKKIGNLFYKIVTVKIKVGKQKGENDPYFSISANLNDDYFKEGEEIKLEIESSKDCYLTIFSITSDGKVATIFPNQYRNNNFLKANTMFKLPNERDKEIGIKFEVNLLPNKKEDTETIKIIATKQKIDFNINNDFKTAYETLMKKLISIPRSDIEEIDLQYFVYEK